MGVIVNYRIYNMEITVFVLRGRGHRMDKEGACPVDLLG